MIISYKYKYLFVELPLTGTSAISRELCLHYKGVPILHKHATYKEFLDSKHNRNIKLFVFSSIRHPADEAVSQYFKHKNAKEGSGPLALKNKKLSGRFFYNLRKKKVSFINEKNADFSTFFLKFYKVPYNNWACISHQQFDFILRFEGLENDFIKVLKLIGIEPIRPLPKHHKTPERRKSYSLYYSSKATTRAKKVFGPFLKEWEYCFPEEWGCTSINWFTQKEFELLNIFRILYWNYIRPHIFPKTIRKKVN